MPLYMYQCSKCNLTFETIRKVSERTSVKCPKCDSRGQLLVSGGAMFDLKGDGFYKRGKSAPRKDK